MEVWPSRSRFGFCLRLPDKGCRVPRLWFCFLLTSPKRGGPTLPPPRRTEDGPPTFWKSSPQSVSFAVFYNGKDGLSAQAYQIPDLYFVEIVFPA